MGTPENVLVVGAGPTGLTLASELYRHGVPCRIVERAAEPNPVSRATDMHARTLEVLQDMGLVDEALAIGHPHRGVSIFADGRSLARMTFEQLDSPFPFMLAITQDRTEALLERHLERLGGRVERKVETARVEPQNDGAMATLLHGNGTWEKANARWVVGCDGASSAVRIGLGLPFEGTSFDDRFLMADVKLTWDESPECFHIFYGDAAFVMVIPITAGGQARLFVSEPPGDHELTLETLRSIFARTVPLAAKIDEAGWMSRFRIHTRIVPKYRVGNVLLAGDAAHIHSPISGQGMNLGIQDAYNLAWKLALVVRGRAPESLLDSYEPERRPLACAVLEDSDKLQRRAMIKEGFGAAMRNQIIQILTRFPPFLKNQRDKNAQLAMSYRGSPIVAEERPSLLSAKLLEDRTTEHPTVRDWRDFASAPAAGDRVPDLRLDDGTVFERLRGTHHTVLLFDGQATTSDGYLHLARIADAVVARWGELVRPVVIVFGGKTPAELVAAAAAGRVWLDPEGKLHARFGAGSECLYVVRPDGYVGFRSQPADQAALERSLARVLLSRTSPMQA
jgi:2-polyprenyl-6-methoxyphenol hydroxylase-like FAD-dependent oxidoreductase